MNYAVKITPTAEKTVVKWKKSNPNLHKKFKKIILELIEHPREGIGHPEALIGGNDVRWSRPILIRAKTFQQPACRELQVSSYMRNMTIRKPLENLEVSEINPNFAA